VEPKENKTTFRTFEDLDVYKVAREFRKAMYGVARRLPEVEKFGLVSQIRRAAVSLTNNIAEGHGRYHYLDQIRFMLQARGSLEELLDDLNVCEDENYLEVKAIAGLREQGWRVYKIANGYIRFLRERKAGGAQAVREQAPTYGIDEEDLDELVSQIRFNDLTI
jgi:four helix bundle protein